MPLYSYVFDSPIDHAFAPQGSPGIVVGLNSANEKRASPLEGTMWYPGKGGHALSFGMTRSGKGLQIIAALTQYNGNTITIDPKGENSWTTAPRRRELGHRVVNLDPFNEINRRYGSKVGVKEATTRFNPLSVIDPKSPDFAEDVMMLADAVIIQTGRDSHWDESAKQLVTGLIAAIIEQARPGDASFRQVRRLLTASDDELSKAVELLYANNPDSLGGRLLRRFLPKPNDKGQMSISPEIGSIKSTADTQTFMFESERLVSSMESSLDTSMTHGGITDSLLGTMDTDASAFDLRELATGRVSLFLVLPVDRLQTYGRWLRMILTLSLRAITRHHTPPVIPVLFILDELGTINPGGGLRMIEQAYGLMAGMGIRIWGFLQDLKQLQHDYPNSWETFIANSEVIQLLKVNDNTTADYFSSRLGQQKIKVNFDFRMEAVMRSDELSSLPSDQCVLLFAGGKNIRMRKVNYLTDYRYNDMYRANPLFPPRPAPVAPVASASSGDGLGQTFKQAFDKFSAFDKEVTGKATAWAKTDGLKHASAAADWAKTDGAEQARKAAAAAAEGAAKAAGWASGKFAAFKARKGPPAPANDDVPPLTDKSAEG